MSESATDLQVAKQLVERAIRQLGELDVEFGHDGLEQWNAIRNELTTAAGLIEKGGDKLRAWEPVVRAALGTGIGVVECGIQVSLAASRLTTEQLP